MTGFRAGPNGAVPPYEERAEQLIREAARLLTALQRQVPLRHGELHEDTERWRDHWALHLAQVDHPEAREDAQDEGLVQ